MEDQLQKMKVIPRTMNRGPKHSVSLSTTDDGSSENQQAQEHFSDKDKNFSDQQNQQKNDCGRKIQQKTDCSLPVSAYQRIENYRIGEIIGQGSFGKVFKAIFLPEMKVVAVKIIDFDSFEPSIRSEIISTFLDEVQLLKEIKMKSQFKFSYDFYAGFQYNNCGFIVMELLQGFSMDELIGSQIYLSHQQEQYYLGSLVLALEQLHTNVQCIHRDIKPENIFIQKNGKLILIDFGCAKKLGKGQRTDSITGTCQYFSPSRFKCDYGYEADYWSFGVLAYELALKDLPFSFPGIENSQEEEKFRRLCSLLKNKKQIRLKELSQHSQHLQDLIENIFFEISNNRNSISSLMKMIKQSKYFENFDWDLLKSNKFEPPGSFSDEQIRKIRNQNFDEQISLQSQFEEFQII